MSALVHIDRAESEAKYVIFTGLAWALTIALTIDHLLIMIALLYHF